MLIFGKETAKNSSRSHLVEEEANGMQMHREFTSCLQTKCCLEEGHLVPQRTTRASFAFTMLISVGEMLQVRIAIHTNKLANLSEVNQESMMLHTSTGLAIRGFTQSLSIKVQSGLMSMLKIILVNAIFLSTVRAQEFVMQAKR